jgi:hypothetical protein
MRILPAKGAVRLAAALSGAAVPGAGARTRGFLIHDPARDPEDQLRSVQSVDRW